MSGCIADVVVAESGLVRPMGAAVYTVSLDSLQPRTVEIGDGLDHEEHSLCKNALYAV